MWGCGEREVTRAVSEENPITSGPGSARRRFVQPPGLHRGCVGSSRERGDRRVSPASETLLQMSPGPHSPPPPSTSLSARKQELGLGVSSRGCRQPHPTRVRACVSAGAAGGSRQVPEEAHPREPARPGVRSLADREMPSAPCRPERVMHGWLCPSRFRVPHAPRAGDGAACGRSFLAFPCRWLCTRCCLWGFAFPALLRGRGGTEMGPGYPGPGSAVVAVAELTAVSGCPLQTVSPVRG